MQRLAPVWMAKSTIVVVPPNAAARVPVSKSSADVAPPNGMSMWVWTSMPPGRTILPGGVDHLVDVGGRDVERHPDDGDLLVLDQHIALVLIDRGDDRAVLDQRAHQSRRDCRFRVQILRFKSEINLKTAF